MQVLLDRTITVGLHAGSQTWQDTGTSVGMAATSEHVCQLFDSDESRAEAVAAFLADGFQAGDYIIAVPRLTTWKLVAARLRAMGISVDEETARGRLTL